MCVHMCVRMCMRACVCVCVCSDQESTQHEEADKINDGKVAAAAELLSGLVVGLGVAAFTWKTGQHDLLPRLTCSTPAHTEHHQSVHQHQTCKQSRSEWKK